MVKVILLLIGTVLCSTLLAEERGTVIIADIRSSKVEYEVEGTWRNLDGAIAALRERASNTGIGPYSDVAIVLANRQLTLEQIQILKSALQAYGFREIRYFSYGSDRNLLRGFSFAQDTIPFTTDRAQLLGQGKQ